MKNKRKLSPYFIMLLIFGLSILLLIKYVNLTWVEMEDDTAKITINFLLPMNQIDFSTHLSVETDRIDCKQFRYDLEWLSPHAVQIKLKEESVIKGLSVYLLIDQAPTIYTGITKSEKVKIQFSTPIKLKEEGIKQLIASSGSITLSFNTPIKVKELKRYLLSPVSFKIKPCKTKINHEEIVDYTRFILTPEKPLENGQDYKVVIQSGLRAWSGNILEKDITMYLQVDKKPIIEKTYPSDGDKWIGLYPKITFMSKGPITQAIAKINGETLKGILIDDTHGYFLLSQLLATDHTYLLEIQAKAKSGELSPIKKVNFSTTTINDKRVWMVIDCNLPQCIHFYQGSKEIKRMACSVGELLKKSDYGTYYLQGKNEVYEDNRLHKGANYWLAITETIGIHGYIRDSYWHIVEDVTQNIGKPIEGRNIMISDEDAKWLYEKLVDQMMIIIK